MLVEFERIPTDAEPLILFSPNIQTPSLSILCGEGSC
jgi:hypothetical protein